ncbi:MAG: oxidoreductase [Acidimicrobiaceae bacterium]|jgi:nucleoside-diphosphate-sugar epimerase|nr:oxidoreductase [Acidimicrobiaceae bacterium]
MRVMLTGATGFIGGHVLRALVDAGHEPLALVRSAEKLGQLRALHDIGAEVAHVVGDMTDAEAVAAAMEGCDACIHTAAFTSLDPEQMHVALEVNAPGAVNVLDAAAAAGCDPIVHLSTMSVIFPPSGDVLSGDDPVQGGGNPYNASKAIAEEHARGMQAAGQPVQILYPAGVTGPTDLGLNVLAANLIPTLQSEIMMSLASGGWLLVDVRDLASAMVGLLTPGRGPQRYVAGGTYMDWGEFHAVVTEVTGCDRALFPTPRDALEQMVDAEAVEIMLGIVPGDDAGLLADSGVGAWRPVEETLHDTVSWLVAGGLLAPDRAPNCT